MPRKKKEIIDVVPHVGLTQQTALDQQLDVIRIAEQEVVSRWQVMAIATKTIHRQRLWELNYESFEHCMSEALGWKKSWAYEMLKAADVLEDAPITDASMARYLHPLEGAKRLTAWQSAVESAQPEKPTRDDVKKAAALLRGGDETPKEEPEEGEKESGAPDQEPTPSIVPPVDEFDRIVAMLREARNAIEELAEKPAGAFVTTAQIVVDLKNVFNALTWAKPHCVCVYCEGEGCKHCQGHGWMCKGLYASAPEDLKQ